MTTTTILALVFFYLLALSSSVSADHLGQFCSGGNYTAKSAFQSNLNLLLDDLSSSNATFFTAAQGSAPDRAFGLVLCRGDAGPTDCAACLNAAAQDVLSLCPFSKQAIVWYDNCQLRYSDLSFFAAVDDSEAYIMCNVNNATDVGPFVDLETGLLDAVSNAAAYNSSIKFATGIATNRSSSQTTYALAQCTRDLSTEDCGDCLKKIRGFYTYVMKIGGRVLGRSCNFRYESSQFFGGKPVVSLDLSPLSPPPPPALPPPPPPPVPPPPASNNDKGETNHHSDFKL